MIKLAEMVKRVLYGLVLISVLGLCYFGYKNYRQRHAMLSGDVFSDPSDSGPPDPSVPLPDPTPTVTQPTAATPGKTSTASPATDSMPANPISGMAYSGSGHFQVYRQGNLTYRINTDSGQSCVLYATNEEWRKSQVYSHGCGNSSAQ